MSDIRLAHSHAAYYAAAIGTFLTDPHSLQVLGALAEAHTHDGEVDQNKVA